MSAKRAGWRIVVGNAVQLDPIVQIWLVESLYVAGKKFSRRDGFSIFADRQVQHDTRDRNNGN